MSDAVCISSSGTPNQRGPDEASRLLRAAIRSAASGLEEGMAARLSLDAARASLGSMGARRWLNGSARERAEVVSPARESAPLQPCSHAVLFLRKAQLVRWLRPP